MESASNIANVYIAPLPGTNIGCPRNLWFRCSKNLKTEIEYIRETK